MCKNNLFLCFSILLFGFVALQAANPIKTVPWDGHQGAVTFTFDDGVQSQIANLKPILEQKGVKVTFFPAPSFYFGSNKSQFAALAKAGHELGNHTMTHANLGGVNDESSIKNEVTQAALALRNLDPSIESVTFANPYCATNNTVDRVVSEEHFMARSCGGQGLFRWGSEPSNWMKMDAYYWQSSSNVGSVQATIDNAAKNNQWYVQLNHGVGGDWDIISVGDITSLINKAIEKKVWINTYQRIGSYYRASFTMDKASSEPIKDGYQVKWTSPHKKLPKSVKLRVTIDKSSAGSSAKVYQKGTEIIPEQDGSYVIEFMEMALEVKSEPIIGIQSQKKLLSGVKAIRTGSEIAIQGLANGDYSYKVSSLSGQLLKTGSFENANTSIDMSSAMVHSGVVILQISSKNGAFSSFHLKVPYLNH